MLKQKQLSNLQTGVFLSSLLLLFSMQNAKALTFVLDFSSLNTSETIFSAANNLTTNALDPTDFGFLASNFNMLTNTLLDGVIDDFTGYPTLASDAASPIPVGKELDIDFEIGTVFNAPSNSDTNYYFMKIGDIDPSTPRSYLGQACQSCVRNSSGGTSVANGALVGSILSNNIANISHIPGDLTQVANLLVGTISHEIGHTLSLGHIGIEANPGQSDYTLLGTGASPIGMPNDQRILDRDFSYAHAGQLVNAIGLRDIAAVPLPASVYLFAFSIALLGFTQRRRKKQALPR